MASTSTTPITTPSTATRWGTTITASTSPHPATTPFWATLPPTTNVTASTSSRNNTLIANTYENSFGIPGISNISSSGIIQNSATITWTTAEDSTSVVEYGTTTAYGCAATDGMTISHSVVLSGLSAGTTYHFRVDSMDGEHNMEISKDFTFTTSSPPPPPPPPPAKASTSLSIDPSSFSSASGGSCTLTAILTSDNVPLAGKTISWSAILGNFSPTSGTTDENGRVTVTYTAPVVENQTTLTVEAVFAGDDSYYGSKGSSTGIISPIQLIPTYLFLTPSSFSLHSFESISLLATLRDNAGNPLAGRNLTWSATAGSLSAVSGLTDSNGQLSVTFTAPAVSGMENVTITVSFGGDNTYAPSQGRSTCTISPAPTTLTITPASFVIGSGETMVLMATLTSGGVPLPDCIVSWSVTAGSLDLSSGITDENGRVRVTYIAPTVENLTTVTITASFTGGKGYSPSTANSIATVLTQEVEQMENNFVKQAAAFGIPLENENLEELEGAFLRGNLGAIVTLTIEAKRSKIQKVYEHENIGISLGEVVVGERVEVFVENTGLMEKGATIVINVDNSVFKVGLPLKVFVDNVEIGIADDYADILNSTDENVLESLILTGGRGTQILVSIPHFSRQVITIRGPLAVKGRWTPLLIAVGILVIIAILLFVFRRRSRRAKV